MTPATIRDRLVHEIARVMDAAERRGADPTAAALRAFPRLPLAIVMLHAISISVRPM
jgi:hypothetical protein